MKKNVYIIIICSLFIYACNETNDIPLYSSIQSGEAMDYLDSNNEFSGCTDMNSINYDSAAVLDDGNCVTSALAGWSLVWNDEFNGTELDLTKWNREVGVFVNNEEQIYTTSEFNSYVHNGFLNIIGESKLDSDTSYTSARLNTSGKHSFKYGRFEASAKLPSSSGSWPAFWMLSEDIYTIGWPLSGEIDIIEYVSNDPGKIHSSIHCEDYNWVNQTESTDSYTLNNVSSGFNLYIVEWYADKLIFKVNETIIHTFENDGFENQSSWPFNTNFFLILNLAIGGDWVEGIDGVIADNYYDRFLIDYVRVYEIDE